MMYVKTYNLGLVGSRPCVARYRLVLTPAVLGNRLAKGNFSNHVAVVVLVLQNFL